MQNRQKLCPHLSMTGSLKKSKQIAHVSSFLRSSPVAPAVAMFTRQQQHNNCRKWRRKGRGEGRVHICGASSRVLANQNTLILPHSRIHSQQNGMRHEIMMHFMWGHFHLSLYRFGFTCCCLVPASWYSVCVIYSAGLLFTCLHFYC